jgi:hypothetical protein
MKRKREEVPGTQDTVLVLEQEDKESKRARRRYLAEARPLVMKELAVCTNYKVVEIGPPFPCPSTRTVFLLKTSGRLPFIAVSRQTSAIFKQAT